MASRSSWATLVTRDSDLTPAIRMLRERFPDKRITLVAPPLGGHSVEMLAHATGKTKILPRHLALSLFPREVRDERGGLMAVRPREYAPPEEG